MRYVSVLLVKRKENNNTITFCFICFCIKIDLFSPPNYQVKGNVIGMKPLYEGLACFEFRKPEPMIQQPFEVVQ